jgi:hypothetical protein
VLDEVILGRERQDAVIVTPSATQANMVDRCGTPANHAPLRRDPRNVLGVVVLGSGRKDSLLFSGLPRIHFGHLSTTRTASAIRSQNA